MNTPSRRDFLKTAGLVAAAGTFRPESMLGSSFERGNPKRFPFALGMASYTLRAFPLDEAIAMTKRLGLTRITLKDMHLPMTLPEPELRAAVDKVRAAGIELASLGVIYMRSEEDVRKAFAYAKLTGVKMITGAPNEDLLPLVEQHVKATDIMIAIHNHGPDKNVYPSPEDAYKAVKGMDQRMGLCIDIGHTMRLGLDPAVEAERFFDRLHDIHIKDVDFAEAKGKTVEIGRGVIDIPKFLRTVVKTGYARTLHFEYEKDQKDPLAGAAESVGYVNGVLATL